MYLKYIRPAAVLIIAMCTVIGAQRTGRTTLRPASKVADSQNFTDIGLQLPGNFGASGTGAWMDYDNDGDLDIFICGEDFISLYRNDGNDQFVDANSNLPPDKINRGYWGDYDNDGDVDVIITNECCDVLWRNERTPQFSKTGIIFTGYSSGFSAWGDYDNDGDLDVLASGSDGGSSICDVYNNGRDAGFSRFNAELPQVLAQAMAWADYDNDGDLDFFLAGTSFYPFEQVTAIYRNNGDGSVTRIQVDIPQTSFSRVSWGDYDNDGDLDLLIAGLAESAILRVYQNMGDGVFIDIEAGLQGQQRGNVSWCDYDLDGDADILAVNRWDDYSRIYRNDGEGVFTDAGEVLPDDAPSAGYWGDYDNDGDPDILMTGEAISRVLKNTTEVLNLPPAAPQNLRSIVSNDTVLIEWDASADDHTPQNGLNYNLRVGSTPYGQEIMSAQADSANGFRRLVQLGNAQMRTQWNLGGFPEGTYYWSVQSIDNAFAASVFAPVDSFTIDEATGLPPGEDRQRPDQFTLFQNYPNPFNPTTHFGFRISDFGFITLKIYNVQGQLVRTVLNKEFAPGSYQSQWDGTDDNGLPVASGVYIYKLRAGQGIQSKKMILLR